MKQGGVSTGTSILKYLRQNCLSYAKLSQQKPHHIISWGTGKEKNCTIRNMPNTPNETETSK